MKATELTEDNQGTREWLEARLGKWTGSEVSNLLKKGRAKDAVFGDTAKAYIYKKMSERGLAKNVFEDMDLWQSYLYQVNPTNRAMEFGTETEPEARFKYFEKTGNIVLTTGSIAHKTIKNFASSPDGCIADQEGNIEGCIEIKVPKPETYIKYKVEIKDAESLKSVNDQYYYQCQSHMMVTDAKWCDFTVYCPFEEESIHIVRIERNEEDIKAIEERIALAEQFINDCGNE